MVSANRGSDHSAGPEVFIPQGTVDNNLGQDRLAGPEALDPNHCSQPTPCLDVLTVHSFE